MVYTVTKVYEVSVEFEFEAASAEEAYEKAAGGYIDEVKVDWEDDAWEPKVYTDHDLLTVAVVSEETPEGEHEIWRDF